MMAIAVSSIGKKVINLQPGIMVQTYGVVLHFDNKTKVHFKAEVSCRRQIDEVHYLFEVNRQQVYINQKEPDLLIERLSDDLGKVLYPLSLVVNHEGFIESIANHPDLLQRWEQRRPDLERYYTGKIAEDIISRMDKAMRQESVIRNKLRQDWFLAMFFSGIYGLKPMDYKQMTPLRLPVIAYGPGVHFAITREITEQHTASKSLIITCKGHLNEERSAKDIAEGNLLPLTAPQGRDSATGTVQLTYRLYHKDFSVRSILCDCQLTLGVAPEKKVRVEIYHLSGEDKLIA